MKNKITTIAFDADDTLWVNEPYFQDAEKEFTKLLSNYISPEDLSKELFKTEMKNLHLYGYGIKSFLLSMIETASKVTDSSAPLSVIDKIVEIGHQLIEKPIELLDGVEETLKALNGNYKLVVATKGDLLDQERKLKKSKLERHFHHIEIMSEKGVSDYQKLLKNLDCKPENFLMLGNSLKSDIMPVLELGAHAAHIPYHVTWAYEEESDNPQLKNFIKLTSINQILDYLT